MGTPGCIHTHARARTDAPYMHVRRIGVWRPRMMIRSQFPCSRFVCFGVVGRRERIWIGMAAHLLHLVTALAFLNLDVVPTTEITAGARRMASPPGNILPPNMAASSASCQFMETPSCAHRGAFLLDLAIFTRHRPTSGHAEGHELVHCRLLRFPGVHWHPLRHCSNDTFTVFSRSPVPDGRVASPPVSCDGPV